MAGTAVIGAVFVDVKGFSRDQYVATGTNIGTIEIVHGGVCRNVCEDFAIQGEAVSFVSMTEDTAIGRDVSRHLVDCGVDLTHLLEAENGLGMWLAILDEHGELVGSISKQPDFSALETYIRANGDWIASEADNIVLEIDMNERIAADVLDFAERHNCPVYSIVGNMGVIMRHPEYLQRVKCFICNEIEASRLFGMDLIHLSPDEMLEVLKRESRRAGIKSMVITMGEQGAVYYNGVESGHCPSIPTVMVDSTGAGDAFFSGTVMALTRGMRLSDAVRIGTKLASVTLGRAESTCCKVDNLFQLS